MQDFPLWSDSQTIIFIQMWCFLSQSTEECLSTLVELVCGWMVVGQSQLSQGSGLERLDRFRMRHEEMAQISPSHNHNGLMEQ